MKTCIDGYECPLAIESNHRIANHLAMLASYVSMQRLEFSRPAAMDGTEVLRLLDGIGALNLIRTKAEASGAAPPPSVAITSNTMSHQVAVYLAAGFDAHIGKPFRKPDLADVLARVGRPARLGAARSV